ncbi:porin [soil metagenome]
MSSARIHAGGKILQRGADEPCSSNPLQAHVALVTKSTNNTGRGYESMSIVNSSDSFMRPARVVVHLVRGSAAALFAITAASAADLPVKAKAVQYLKICSEYGVGYYYMPGTDTCIKVSGYVRADANINGASYDKPGWDQSAGQGTKSRDRDYFTTRVRTELQVDTRTATEYGVLRTYTNPRFQFDTGAGPETGVITLDYGFIQFAGFTLGKAVSTFQTPWGAAGANSMTSFLIGGYDNINGITQIAYTWQFGNGVSAQVAVEDNKTINRAQLLNASLTQPATGVFTGAFTNSYGGAPSPDLVGNVRIDQAAFLAQLSGAAHEIRANYYAGPGGVAPVEPNGHPSDAWGFAVMGGLQLKNLPTGPGDKLSLDVSYVNGASKYLISGVTGTAFESFSGGPTNFPGSYQNMAVLSLTDGVYTTGSRIEKTSGWGFRAGFLHNWSPNWETGIFGSYSRITYDAAANSAFCGVFTALSPKSNGFTCNPDFTIWQVGQRTAWTPVKSLTFSVEVLYTMLDQSHSGSQTLANPGPLTGTFKPTAVYDFKDQGIVSGLVGVRRTF